MKTTMLWLLISWVSLFSAFAQSKNKSGEALKKATVSNTEANDKNTELQQSLIRANKKLDSTTTELEKAHEEKNTAVSNEKKAKEQNKEKEIILKSKNEKIKTLNAINDVKDRTIKMLEEQAKTTNEKHKAEIGLFIELLRVSRDSVSMLIENVRQDSSTKVNLRELLNQNKEQANKYYTLTDEHIFMVGVLQKDGLFTDRPDMYLELDRDNNSKTNPKKIINLAISTKPPFNQRGLPLSYSLVYIDTQSKIEIIVPITKLVKQGEFKEILPIPANFDYRQHTSGTFELNVTYESNGNDIPKFKKIFTLVHN